MAGFPKKAARPYLQPMMLAIQAAMRERNLDVKGLSEALGAKSPAIIYNWVAGKNGVGDAYRARLAQVLGLTEAQLTSPQAPGAHSKRPAALGPAQRAVALVQAAPPGAVPVVTEPVRDVFTIAGRTDGQITVQLRATLDAGRGMALARFLLDFGLIVGDEPANEKGAGIAAGARGRD
jgi:hypothetical protein